MTSAPSIRTAKIAKLQSLQGRKTAEKFRLEGELKQLTTAELRAAMADHRRADLVSRNVVGLLLVALSLVAGLVIGIQI